MQEIKFRAMKDDMSDTSFVYGYLVITPNGIPRIMNDVGGLFTTCLKGTEGQFIGVMDENKKDVYEGDIIEYYNWEAIKDDDSVDSDLTRKMVVKWSLGGYFYDDEMGNDYCVPIGSRDDDIYFRVIGNIYENPELLTLPL